MCLVYHMMGRWAHMLIHMVLYMRLSQSIKLRTCIAMVDPILSLAGFQGMYLLWHVMYLHVYNFIIHVIIYLSLRQNFHQLIAIWSSAHCHTTFSFYTIYVLHNFIKTFTVLFQKDILISYVSKSYFVWNFMQPFNHSFYF